MYNSEIYLVEKQAHRQAKPLSQAEMAHLYGRSKGSTRNLVPRLGAAVNRAVQAFKVKASARPALGTK